MSNAGKSNGGFWKQVIAYLIDITIIGVPAMLFFGGGISDTMTSSNASAMRSISIEMAVSEMVLLVVSWIYFSGQENSAWQATVGKKILGIKVTDSSGQIIGIVIASIQYAAKFFSYCILMIGFIMGAFTEKKKGLHDFIAGTVVVSSR